MAKVRFDYYEATAVDGDAELFKRKIESILANLKEKDREVQVGTSLYNFTAEIEEKTGLIVGNIRDLRYVVPSKGKMGTNKTEPITLLEDEGISEKTHFVYDFKKNKLAIQYNYHGPKVANLFGLVNKLYKEKILPTTTPPQPFVLSSYQPFIVGSEIELALTTDYITCITARAKNPIENGDVFDQIGIALKMLINTRDR